ncbi:hypothetical protein MYCTH_2307916 [Thermothelomyces thermophilus ATCC 42464]|uniref:Uncharacterized protein n=1 Tax=Thermothelomyces thermophilus (strain ATCC 42464 / BCRC 31852 / DSM 1799) TaxID=573729 RepID=G2QIK2_THET4|nr:uncharacterized protein MYCTH_2307916 [Thermothelomyces thermophilus ATCC 42464]AEO59533.1 hypothetical protein MYCTH_2307916 [Thermothelomyces thermophilus ATCC 42464]
METAVAVENLSPLAVARRPMGAVFTTGPFKPISQGFSLFFEALLSAVALGNADTLETLAHLDVSTVSSISENEDDKGVPAFSKPSTSHQTPVPEISACPAVETPGPVDSAIIKEDNEAAATITLRNEDSQGMNAESPTVTAVTQDVIASQQAETALACTEDSTAPVDASLPDITRDAEPVIDEAEGSTSIAVACATEEQHDASEVDLIVSEGEAVAAAECTLDAEVQVTDNVSDETQHTESPKEDSVCVVSEGVTDTVTSAVDTLDNSLNSSIEAAKVSDVTSAAAGLDNIEDTSAAEVSVKLDIESNPADKPEAVATQDITSAPENISHQDFIEDSESVAKDVIEDIVVSSNENLDTNADVAVEATDEELTQISDVESMETISDEGDEEPMPLPVFPLILEDDFDAPVSSTFQAGLELLMEIDTTWCVPQIVEKGKSERERVRERLANRSTAQFNLQNLRLEKAALALTINGGPVHAQPSRKVAALPTRVPPAKRDIAVPETKDGFAQTEVADAPARNHSRSTSASSSASKISADAVFDSAPCPGTPVTEYTGTPTKEVQSHAAASSDGKVVPQQVSRDDKINNTIGIAKETESLHTPATVSRDVDETRN